MSLAARLRALDPDHDDSSEAFRTRENLWPRLCDLVEAVEYWNACLGTKGEGHATDTLIYAFAVLRDWPAIPLKHTCDSLLASVRAGRCKACAAEDAL